MLKFIKNRDDWALLRAPNHGFPVGILHLTHIAPYGLTFVCQASLGTATIDSFTSTKPLFSCRITTPDTHGPLWADIGVSVTITKPWFSCRSAPLGTHGSLWADMYMPECCMNCHYWTLLRASNHGCPGGILHLAHPAPYEPTSVC